MFYPSDGEIIMNKPEKNSCFKSGIWIKEQQGCLTIGSLDKSDTAVKIIPESLRQTLADFETDMVEALYGETATQFKPGVINIQTMLDEIQREYKSHNLRISVSGTENNIFKGNYDKLSTIIQRLVNSSLTETPKDNSSPIIYINASLLEDHLCIIYRDSESICHPDKLKKEITYIKKAMNGEVSFKATGTEKSYFDIMIPSQK